MKYVIINRQRRNYQEDVDLIQNIEQEIKEPSCFIFLSYNESLKPDSYMIVKDPIQTKLYEFIIEQSQLLSKEFEKVQQLSQNKPDWYNGKFFCGRTINIPNTPLRFAK